MASSQTPPDVTGLFGPLLIGALLNTLLYGVMAVQAFLYFQHYTKTNNKPKGSRLVQVAYLVVIETASLVCNVGVVYEPLITRYARPEALIVSPILLRPDAALTVLVSAPTQLFVAWRLHVITRSYFLSALIAILAFVAFVGGIVTSVVVSLHPNFASFASFKPEVITWLVASTACDVVLTAALVFSLWTRKTKMASTDSYVNKIIRLTVQTGLITATAALLDLLLYIAFPNASYNFILDFALSKLYTNSLISTLNARPWRESALGFAPNVLFEQSKEGTSGSRSLSRGPGQTFGLTQTATQTRPMGLTYPPVRPFLTSDAPVDIEAQYLQSGNATGLSGVNVNVKMESFVDVDAAGPYGDRKEAGEDARNPRYIAMPVRYQESRAV
ncbi:hypothetical protein MIND_00189500 [Mycena indigotica]|uniref:DUF6534 domain-containing protein n=1 Tax=Mycena indigotica TaxID=2126181 RepID=A0A8H6T6H6_9AGAR|nr:uncharacterized protein MIND_00189500 [Mycena indigotica]KAF7311790.1 hypothetical protein MIND_00189500 [Mycena indigotica]